MELRPETRFRKVVLGLVVRHFTPTDTASCTLHVFNKYLRHAVNHVSLSSTAECKVMYAPVSTTEPITCPGPPPVHTSGLSVNLYRTDTPAATRRGSASRSLPSLPMVSCTVGLAVALVVMRRRMPAFLGGKRGDGESKA